MLHLEGDINDAYLFYEMKNLDPGCGEAFYFPKVGWKYSCVTYFKTNYFQTMGSKTFNKLLITAVNKCGIDRGRKKTTNQSLRPTTFNAQVCSDLEYSISGQEFIRDIYGCFLL